MLMLMLEMGQFGRATIGLTLDQTVPTTTRNFAH